MGTLWVLTANRGFAKIYEVKGVGRQIKEIYSLEHPEGHLKPREVYSDRPGRMHDRMGVGRHSVEEKAETHEEALKEFVHKIAKLLLEGKDNRAFDELAIVVPSHFLGELKQVLAERVKKCITKEAHKDLPEYLTEYERLEHLTKLLDLWNYHPSTSRA